MSANFPINPDPRFRLTTAVGGETSFSVPFPFMQNADIAVIKYTVDGVALALDEGADYTLTGVPVVGAVGFSGGTVVLQTAMLGGERVLRVGRAVLDRVSSIVRTGKFSSLAVDSDLDRALIIVQELFRDVGQSLRVPYGSPVQQAMAAPAAGRLLIWNEAGDQIINGPTAENVARAEEFALDAAGFAELAGTKADAAAAQADVAGQAKDDAVAAAVLAEELVEEATSGFIGFQDGLGYDFGTVTASVTYFDRDWGSL